MFKTFFSKINQTKVRERAACLSPPLNVLFEGSYFHLKNKHIHGGPLMNFLGCEKQWSQYLQVIGPMDLVQQTPF